MAQTHQSPPKELRKPNENHTRWLLRRVWNRLNVNNEHFMGVIVGQEGSGKSYTAIKIAEMVDPTFTADRVIFDVAELLEVLQNGNHEPGQFYVLDEAGVQLGVRTWQDRGQVLANQALQLIRSHNLGLLFTLPRLGELDSQAQGRLQAFLEMQDKVDGEYVTLKWKWMEPDRADDTGKIYKKFPRRRQNGAVMRVREFAFAPPSDAIIDPYEETKSEFQQDFYEKTIEELSDEQEDSDSSGSADSMGPKEIAMEIADGPIGKFVSRHGTTNEPYINKDLIRMDYEISHSDAKGVKSLLEKQFSSDELEQYI